MFKITDYILSSIPETADSSFGTTFSAFGKYLAVGAPEFNSGNGAVVIYEDRENGYELASNFSSSFLGVLSASDEMISAKFGTRIDTTETSIVVGGDPSISSLIFIFKPTDTNAYKYQDQIIQGANITINKKEDNNGGILKADSIELTGTLKINGINIQEGNIFNQVGMSNSNTIYQQKDNTTLLLNGTDQSIILPGDKIVYGNIGNIHFNTSIVSFDSNTELRIYTDNLRTEYDTITPSPWKPIISCNLTGGDIYFNSGTNFIQNESRIGIHTTTPNYTLDINGSLGVSSIITNTLLSCSLNTTHASFLNGNLIISSNSIIGSTITANLNILNSNTISVNNIITNNLTIPTLVLDVLSTGIIHNDNINTKIIKNTENNKIELLNGIECISSSNFLARVSSNTFINITSNHVNINSNIILNPTIYPLIHISSEIININFEEKPFEGYSKIASSFLYGRILASNNWSSEFVKLLNNEDKFILNTGTDIVFLPPPIQEIGVIDTTYNIDVSKISSTQGFFLIDNLGNNIISSTTAGYHTISSVIFRNNIIPLTIYYNLTSESFVYFTINNLSEFPLTFGYYKDNTAIFFENSINRIS